MRPVAARVGLLVLWVMPGVLTGCGCREGAGRAPGRLARELQASGGTWWMASNDWAVVYARNADPAPKMAAKAAYCLERAARLFSLEDRASRPLSVYMLADPGEWKRLIRRHELEPNAISLLDGSDIVLLLAEPDDWKSDALAHEIVHYVLGRKGWRLPLAIEEGTALHYGWELNLAAHLRLGDVVRRRERPRPEGELLPMARLEAASAYPSDPDEVRAFYFQSERWVRALVEIVGQESYAAFLQRLGSTRQNWRDLLAGEYGGTHEQEEWITGVAAGDGAARQNP